MKRREQPRDIPTGEMFYTLPNLGIFSDDKWGCLVLKRPFSLGSIEIGRRLRPLLRPLRETPDGLGLPIRAFIGDAQVQADLGALLAEAWAHPTYEMESTGAGLVQEFVEVLGVHLAPIVLARLILEAHNLSSIDDLYAWEVEAVAAPPFEVGGLPSASA